MKSKEEPIPSDVVPVWLTDEYLLPRSFVEKYLDKLHDINNQVIHDKVINE